MYFIALNNVLNFSRCGGIKFSLTFMKAFSRVWEDFRENNLFNEDTLARCYSITEEDLRDEFTKLIY